MQWENTENYATMLSILLPLITTHINIGFSLFLIDFSTRIRFCSGTGVCLLSNFPFGIRVCLWYGGLCCEFPATRFIGARWWSLAASSWVRCMTRCRQRSTSAGPWRRGARVCRRLEFLRLLWLGWLMLPLLQAWERGRLRSFLNKLSTCMDIWLENGAVSDSDEDSKYYKRKIHHQTGSRPFSAWFFGLIPSCQMTRLGNLLLQ